MKSTAWILACYLALGSMFPGSDFSQIPRLAEAIRHYSLHLQEADDINQTFSTLDFLSLHYFKPHKHHKAPHHNHHNLPFQSLDHLVISILDLPAYRELPIINTTEIIQRTAFVFLHPVGNDFSTPLLQPPVSA